MSPFVSRKSIVTQVFLRQLAMRLTGDPRYVYVEHEDLWYLGGGYWRAKIRRDAEDSITGVDLINPDKTYRELCVVAAAMNILI